MIEEQRRREDILKAEETIRALAKELGTESERIKRLDSATRSLDESRGALLNVNSLVQQSVLAVEGAHAKVVENLDATTARQLALNGELSSRMTECQTALFELGETLTRHAKSLNEFSEAQRQNGIFIRRALISLVLANATVVIILLVHSFFGRH